MRVVVTGASGFVGGAVLRSLRGASIDAVGVSRREVAGCTRVADYADSPAGDVLIHLAQESDRAVTNAGGAGAERQASATLSALLGRGYAKVVYVSSAVLYSDDVAHPRRTDEPIRVTDVYSRIKANSESAVLSGGAQNAVARLANVYGPGMSASNVVSAILRQLGSDGPLHVRDAAPIRDFIWYEDVGSALAVMGLAPGSGIFNVGTGVGTSIAELARTALHLVGQPSRPVVSAATTPAASTLVLDCSHTRRQFGWQAQVSVRQGLALMLGQSGNGQENNRDLHRE